MVRSICTGSVPVYDLDVEEHSNFFAGGILVHNCIIIDDPIKNDEEASSETIRDSIWREWQATIQTRLEQPGFVIVIQTRWHQDDLAGRLQAQSRSGEGPPWDVINFPALATDNDPLGRDVGDALWEGHKTTCKDALLTLKKGMTPYYWSALYQGNPTPDEGGTVDRRWWQFWDELPARFDQIIMSWDLAFKDLKKSDYCVGAVWARKGAMFYLLDLVRDRMDAPTIMSAFRSLTYKWPLATLKLVEDAANGPAIFQMLRHEVPGIVLWPPKGQKRSSKDERISAVAPLIRAGNVYLPNPKLAPWVHDFIEEHAAFPHGTNDDQVDTTSQALGFLRTGAKRAVDAAWGEAEQEGAIRSPAAAKDLTKLDFQHFVKKSIKESDRRHARASRGTIHQVRRLSSW